MKKLKTRKWKDEVNALMQSHHIKRIREMSLGYLRELLSEAMNIGYGFQQEENPTKHNKDFTAQSVSPKFCPRNHRYNAQL